MAYMFQGETIKACEERDPAAGSYLEVDICYPGVHTFVWHKLSHVLCPRRFNTLRRILPRSRARFTGIDIHPAEKLGLRLLIERGPDVVTGATARQRPRRSVQQRRRSGPCNLSAGRCAT